MEGAGLRVTAVTAAANAQPTRLPRGTGRALGLRARSGRSRVGRREGSVNSNPGVAVPREAALARARGARLFRQRVERVPRGGGEAGQRAVGRAGGGGHEASTAGGGALGAVTSAPGSRWSSRPATAPR